MSRLGKDYRLLLETFNNFLASKPFRDEADVSRTEWITQVTLGRYYSLIGVDEARQLLRNRRGEDVWYIDLSFPADKEYEGYKVIFNNFGFIFLMPLGIISDRFLRLKDSQTHRFSDSYRAKMRRKFRAAYPDYLRLIARLNSQDRMIRYQKEQRVNRNTAVTK